MEEDELSLWISLCAEMMDDFSGETPLISSSSELVKDDDFCKSGEVEEDQKIDNT